jgi:hypothetical protein
MSTALLVLQTGWMLALLVLVFSRPIVSICDDYAEVACAGDPSDEWINSNLLGPSLPPAGTIINWAFYAEWRCLTTKDRGSGREQS